jgi:hypothetical protein
MKKILIVVFLLTAIPLYALAQLSTNVYYDGYWGEWKKQYYTYSKQSWYQIYGNYSGFIIYYASNHPSKYLFKFQINSYRVPSKEEIKNHRKNDIWYEYTGTVEYSVNSSYPTIKDALKSTYNFPCVTNGDGYKRTVNAEIRIAPYKDHPKAYNIWFEDIGIAIDLGTSSFPE